MFSSLVSLLVTMRLLHCSQIFRECRSAAGKLLCLATTRMDGRRSVVLH